jgi:hypothetical protein
MFCESFTNEEAAAFAELGAASAAKAAARVAKAVRNFFMNTPFKYHNVSQQKMQHILLTCQPLNFISKLLTFKMTQNQSSSRDKWLLY